MNHFAEDDLIAYQMGEFVDSAPARTIAAHLEQCPPCASLAEEIARTLRVFSADPAPLPNVDHAWQRLLVNLPALHPASHSSFRQPATQSAARLLKLLLPVLAVLLVAAGVTLRLHTTARPASRLAAGPLTEQPGDPLAASASPQSAAIAAHLDDAERLLTTVSHEPGAMDPTTHAQGPGACLLQNARLCPIRPLADGDLPEASRCLRIWGPHPHHSRA